MKKSRSSKSPDYLIVPNTKDLERPFGSRRKKKQAKNVKWLEDRMLLANAYKANLYSKDYDLVRNEDIVIVRNKNTGRILSKFSVEPVKKNATLRKLRLEPRSGTVRIKRILDAI